MSDPADINAEAVSKAIESTRASLRSAKSFLSSKDFTETLKKAVDRSVSTGHQDRKDVALVLDVKEGTPQNLPDEVTAEQRLSNVRLNFRTEDEGKMLRLADRAIRLLGILSATSALSGAFTLNENLGLASTPLIAEAICRLSGPVLYDRSHEPEAQELVTVLTKKASDDLETINRELINDEALHLESLPTEELNSVCKRQGLLRERLETAMRTLGLKLRLDSFQWRATEPESTRGKESCSACGKHM